MPEVVYDTNVASLAFTPGLPADLADRLAGTDAVLSFVTVGELEKWAEVRAWGRRPRGAADAWTSSHPAIDSDHTVSRIWGRLAAAARRRGDGTSENDLWIAAAAWTPGCPW